MWPGWMPATPSSRPDVYMYWMLRLPESGVVAVPISIVLIGLRPSPQSASSWSAFLKKSRSAGLVATACAIIVRCTFWLVRK